ncbi:MAG: bifunctional DNA-binding transcriptional regulator/O6-methylguanine-DNA methyltransferase Ada [Alphaproteobacteria bacterium]|nr:bifunctional DNA-binding transcriptional regulator/O6-methylguanine-DNA methyltransferase Ada [Alphaproteobacteria bacterium]
MTAFKTDTDRNWQRVLDRDRTADGSFVYAVKTTGIYCRPSCPSRKPKRENAVFFALPEAARQAGYRPCKRCRPQTVVLADGPLARIHRACEILDAAEDPVTLEDLGAAVGLSPTHLQRSFTQTVGVSPKAYWDQRRANRLKRDLKSEASVTTALYDAGYGSSSRLYEKADKILGMTPATYGKGGAGARITYGTAPTDLGLLLIAATEKGVCFLGIVDADDQADAEIAREFPKAERIRDNGGIAAAVATIGDYLKGKTPHPDLPLDVRWTAFQRQVWAHLVTIPPGETRTYTEVAEALGKPAAIRAVARACATNPVSLVVPCHRVFRTDGSLAGYRWGLERKATLLKRERARAGG